MPTTVIYADSLLLVNFSMDFLALFVTARLSSRPVHALRMAGAAAIGAAFALVSILTERYLTTPVSAVLSAACAGIMVLTAFGGNVRGVMRTALTFGAVNIGLGGIMTAIYSILGRAAVRIGLEAPENEPSASPLLFVLIALISGAVSLFYGRIRQNRTKHAGVRIRLCGGERVLTMLCDSGNLLREPISGRPAVIVSLDAVRGILIEDLCKCAEHPEKIAGLSQESAKSVRLMTAESITGQALMLGILPERFECEGREYEVCLVLDAKNSNFGGCDGIIPEALME